MDAINRAANTVGAKNEVYAASMHMFHFTDFPQQLGELLRQAPALDVARLAMWRTGSADDRHIPSPETEGVAFSARGFSLVKSCNLIRMARRDHERITPRSRRNPPRWDACQSRVDV
jgi:hypothetical protein